MQLRDSDQAKHRVLIWSKPARNSQVYSQHTALILSLKTHVTHVHRHQNHHAVWLWSRWESEHGRYFTEISSRSFDPVSVKRLRLILIQQVFIDRDETQIANVRKKAENPLCGRCFYSGLSTRRNTSVIMHWVWFLFSGISDLVQEDEAAVSAPAQPEKAFQRRFCLFCVWAI